MAAGSLVQPEVHELVALSEIQPKTPEVQSDQIHRTEICTLPSWYDRPGIVAELVIFSVLKNNVYVVTLIAEILCS